MALQTMVKILLPQHTVDAESGDEDEACRSETSQETQPHATPNQYQHVHLPRMDGHVTSQCATDNEQEAVLRHGGMICVSCDDLIRSVAFGDCETVQRCLASTKGVKQSFSKSQALFIAARSGNTVMFEMLLEYGFNPTVALTHGQRPIHYAAYYGNINIVQLLLQKTPSVSFRDKMGHTPLHYAVDTTRGNRDMIVFLVETFRKLCRKNVHGTTSDVVNDVSCTGLTPLRGAIWRTKVDHVKCLCELGAKPTFEDCRMAVLKRDVVILSYLVQRNAPLVQETSSYSRCIRTDKTNTHWNVIVKTQSNANLDGNTDSSTSGKPYCKRKRQSERTSKQADDTVHLADDSLLRLACDIEKPHKRREIIRVLFKGGYNIANDLSWIMESDLPVFSGREGEAFRQFLIECSNVRSLQYLSSLRIRHLLGSSLSSTVCRLPVPESIKNMIRLKWYTM
ncbi:poly [ADP-ribose] polymerase tankyrase-2-like [Haliotis asinina]|uniref:poly [ADP-ribose] polymerase tankyrase-2-like n=1 Tax=Haliotis asinina TaxID=109174 RepID=UPI003531DCCB